MDGFIDVSNDLPEPPVISLSTQETNRLLGTDHSTDEIQKFLVTIEFKVEAAADDRLAVTPPSFRVDVTRPEDLMEEVARLSGYDNIPTTYPLIPAETREPSTIIDHRHKLKTIMTGFGFDEAINYSFMDTADCDRLLLDDQDYRRKLVSILNPLTEDQSVMRTAMVPGLLSSTRRNISQQTKTCRLFEIGKVFIGKGQTELPNEIEMLAGIWTGSRSIAAWNLDDNPCDFYDIKGVVEGLFSALKIEDITFTSMRTDGCPFVMPGASALIRQADIRLGLIGELHPQILKNYDLKQQVFYFELDLNQLYGMIPASHQAKAISIYPAISRDVTVIIDDDIESVRLLDFIRDLNEDLVEQLNIFDIFADDPIPAGKKSVSFRIVYRSHESTLEDSQINELHKRLSQKVIDQFNAALPE